MDAIDRSRRGRHSPALRSNVFTETRCERRRRLLDVPVATWLAGAAVSDGKPHPTIASAQLELARRPDPCSFRPEATEFGPRPLWGGADRVPDH